MHFDEERRKNISRESYYLYVELTLNALFLPFGVHDDVPFGLVGIFRGLSEGGPGFKTFRHVVSVCLEGVLHG